MIQFAAETTIDGKQVHAIEVAYENPKRLEELENKMVKARGKVSHRRGIETGERMVLEITSIREMKESQGEG